MGFLDHRKEWLFDVHADPARCEGAFMSALTGDAVFGLRGKYTFSEAVDDSGHKTVATYVGRRGLSSLGLLSSTTAEHVAAASGTNRIAFTTHLTGNGTTRCHLWLENWAQMKVGLIADGGFLKRGMQAVRRELRRIDVDMTVRKG